MHDANAMRGGKAIGDLGGETVNLRALRGPRRMSARSDSPSISSETI